MPTFVVYDDSEVTFSSIDMSRSEGEIVVERPLVLATSRKRPKRTLLDVRQSADRAASKDQQGSPNTQQGIRDGGSGKIPPILPPTTPRFGSDENFAFSIRGDEREERDLVRRAQEFDPAAFGEIYERYYDGVYKYISFKTGNQSDVEDLTEETFLKAMVSIDQYTFRGVAFSAWLYAIARNCVIDSYRRRSARGNDLPFEDSVSVEEDKNAQLTTLFDQALEIRTPAQKARFRHDIAVALATLTLEQREVIELKFLDGLSNLEVAHMTGRTEGAVKAMQHRALSTMAMFLRKNEPTSPHITPSAEFEFATALFRDSHHPVHVDLKSQARGAEVAQQRWQLWIDVIVPYIDERLSLNKTQILYHLVYDGMDIGEIEKHLGEGVDVNLALTDAREEILNELKAVSELELEELQQMFRGTRALFSFSRPLPRQWREMKERITKRAPQKPPESYRVLTLEQEDLRRLFGPQ